MTSRSRVVDSVFDRRRTLPTNAQRKPQPRIVLTGRPGAGKGTQGVRLARRLGVQYVSTGELLRHEITAQSPLGSAVERLVRAGLLLPTGLIMGIVETTLDGGGYVLDGFPRTVEQTEALFKRPALTPTVAVDIDVPSHIARSRLRARGRHDDEPEVVDRRLAVYDTQTVRAIDWFGRHELLVRVDGNDGHDAVERTIWRGLCAHRRASEEAPPLSAVPAIRSAPDAATRWVPSERMSARC